MLFLYVWFAVVIVPAVAVVNYEVVDIVVCVTAYACLCCFVAAVSNGLREQMKTDEKSMHCLPCFVSKRQDTS